MNFIFLALLMVFSNNTMAEHNLDQPKKFNCDTVRDYDTRLAHYLVEKQDALLLDVRTLLEYKISNIKGSKRIHVGDLKDKIQDLKKWVNNDMEKPVVVYCAAGLRAEKAKKILQENGFKCVQNLGGISDW